MRRKVFPCAPQDDRVTCRSSWKHRTKSNYRWTHTKVCSCFSYPMMILVNVCFLLLLCYTTDFFPLCIVWSPIPCLSWLMPVIGHLGMFYFFLTCSTPYLTLIIPHKDITSSYVQDSSLFICNYLLTSVSGVASSEGIIYDFAGSYYIHVC